METIEVQVQPHVKEGSNNKIDKDVQLIFRPINLMQTVLLNPKYHIKDGLIFPNNNSNKLIIKVHVVSLAILYFLRLIFLIFVYYKSNMFSYLVFNFLYDCIFRCVGLATNFVINVKKTTKNVQFVLSFQQAHRLLSNVSCDNHFIKRSWMSIAAIFAFYFVLIVYIFFILTHGQWDIFMNVTVKLMFDINIVYVLRLVKLLRDKLVLWNTQFLLAQKNGCSRLHSTGLFHAYVQILQCYNIIQDVYNGPVSFIWYYFYGISRQTSIWVTC